VFDLDSVIWGLTPYIDCFGGSCYRVFSYDPRSEIWTNYTDSLVSSFIPCNLKSIMVDSDNNKYFLFDDLLKYDNQNWSTILIPDSFKNHYSQLFLARIDKGNTFFVMTDQGLLECKDNIWKFYFFGDMGINDPNNVFFDAIVDDSNNLIMLVYVGGTPPARLVIYDGNNFIVRNAPTFGQYSYPTAVARFKNGPIYIGYAGGSLVSYNNDQFATIINEGTITQIHDLTFDSYGSLWISAYFSDYGVYKYDSTGISDYFGLSNSPISYDFVNGILVDQFNNKWISVSNSGIVVFNENGISIPPRPEPDDTIPDNIPLIFPNPTMDIININLSKFNIDELVKLRIFDSRGRLVNSFVIIAENRIFSFSMINYNAGVYFFNFQSQSINRTIKIVKL
jgi:hypothetical protein